jgi:NADPH-dependent 2,4-dienoyl-CoA reductase/sulfur reductase-like enzyme
MEHLPLASLLGAPMGAAIASLHRDEGVALRTGLRVSSVEGQNRAEAIRLSDGSRIDADLIVVGIGVIPETEFLTGSGVDVRDGVLCDARCATNVPNVVAAGDVARWPNPLFGEEMRIEHWTNAAEQAAHAVRRLIEGPALTAEFAPAPYVWSDQHGVKIQFAGRCRPTDEFSILEGSASERKLLAAYFRDGIVVGALTFNRPASLMKYRQLIAQRAPRESPS